MNATLRFSVVGTVDTVDTTLVDDSSITLVGNGVFSKLRVVTKMTETARAIIKIAIKTRFTVPYRFYN